MSSLRVAVLAMLTTVIMGQEPYLRLQPNNIIKSLGASVYVSCSAVVSDPNLVTEMKWTAPDDLRVPNSDDTIVTIEDSPGNLGLLIRNLKEHDTGTYYCSAVYAGNQNLEASIDIKSYVAIDFGDTPTLQTPIEGTDAVIKCMVTSSPSPQVDWLKDGIPLRTDERHIIQQDGVLVRQITEEDEGVYRCRARVAQLGALEILDIQVQVHSPPAITQPPQDASGVEKEAVTFQCVATGKPAPQYSWVDKDSRPLENVEGYYVNEVTGELTILDLRPDQAGLYRCTATNAGGTDTAEANLRVLTKPKLERFLNITADVNTAAEFRCTYSGDPLPQIIFQKETNPEPFMEGINNDDRIEVRHSVDEFGHNVGIMKIHDVSRADDGLYTCTGNSSGGVTVGWGHITVQFPPTFEEQSYDEFWSLEREKVNLTCVATSIPNATIQWYLRNKEIPREDQNFRVLALGPVGVLQVTPLDNSYYGTYTCEATNPLGTLVHDVYLKQVHKPGPITSAQVKKLTATTITWFLADPLDDGGRPITVFLVQYKHSDMSWDQAVTHSWTKGSSYSLEGLVPQQYYTFRFAAKNEVGTSEWSGEKTEQMHQIAAPEEPMIFIKSDGVNAVPYSDHYDLQWKAPLDNGSPITAFTIIHYQVSNRSDTWKVLGAKTEKKLDYPGPTTYRLNNLRPDTYYRIELRARNDIGNSLPAEVIIKTADDPNAPHAGPAEGPIYSEPRLGVGVIVAIAVVAVLVLALILDLVCFFSRDSGVTAAVARKIASKEKDKEAMLEPGKSVSSGDHNKAGAGPTQEPSETTPMMSPSAAVQGHFMPDLVMSSATTVQHLQSSPTKGVRFHEQGGHSPHVNSSPSQRTRATPDTELLYMNQPPIPPRPVDSVRGPGGASRPRSGVAYDEFMHRQPVRVFSSMHNILEDEDTIEGICTPQPTRVSRDSRLTQSHRAKSQGDLLIKNRAQAPPLPVRDPRTKLSSSNILEDIEKTSSTVVPVSTRRPSNSPPFPPPPSEEELLLSDQSSNSHQLSRANRDRPQYPHCSSYTPPPLRPTHRRPSPLNFTSVQQRVQASSPAISEFSSSSDVFDLRADSPKKSSKKSVAFKIAPYVKEDSFRFKRGSSPPSSVTASITYPTPPKVAYKILPYRDVDQVIREHPLLEEHPSTDSDMYQIPDRAPSLHNLIQMEEINGHRSSPNKQYNYKAGPPPLPLNPPPSRPPPQFRSSQPLKSSPKHIAQSLYNLNDFGAQGYGRREEPSPELPQTRSRSILIGRSPPPLHSAYSMGDLLSSSRQLKHVTLSKPSAL